MRFMGLMKKEAFRNPDCSWLAWCGSGLAPFPPFPDRRPFHTRRKVKPEEAARMGLVSEQVPKERLMEAALACAAVLAGKREGGPRLTKRVLEQNIDAPSLNAAIDLENRNQTLMVFSGDVLKRIEPFFKARK
jgi:enoyl-CoA hydratase/carnithine racemase